MNRPYTVLYALTRDLSPPHECYHHLQRVWAPHDIAAVDLCKDDALPGFVFRVLVVLDGHADTLHIGKHCLVHTEILGSP